MHPLPDSGAALLIDAALRGALVALLAMLIFLALTLLRAHRRNPVTQVGIALCAGLMVQVLASSPWFEQGEPRWWAAPLLGVSVANSSLFWLFARVLFDDAFVPDRRHIVIWLAVFALGVLYCACAIPIHPVTPLKAVLTGAMRWTPALFAVLALAAAAAQWHSDLVESRRRLRRFIAVGGILYTLTMVVARVVSHDGRIGVWVAVADAAGLLLLVAGVVAMVLRPGGRELLARPDAERPLDAGTAATLGRAPEPVPARTSGSPELPAARSNVSAPPEAATPLSAVPDLSADMRPAPDPGAGASTPPDPADDRLAARLEQLMSGERLYRREDLTVASLAARLGVPDYRLRRLINQRLGHRNFNAYINGYRLNEAQVALADPGRQQLPVLTIALDAGFQSIGPFNRAFKAATGLTPTEFRREKLADS